MKTKTLNLTLENQLNRRLKYMGFLLLTFALIAVIWDFFPTVENEIDQLLFEMEETPEPLSVYLTSSTFVLVGGACLFVHYKKKKLLSSISPPEQ